MVGVAMFAVVFAAGDYLSATDRFSFRQADGDSRSTVGVTSFAGYLAQFHG